MILVYAVLGGCQIPARAAPSAGRRFEYLHLFAVISFIIIDRQVNNTAEEEVTPMKKLALTAMLLFLAGFAYAYDTPASYKAQDYQLHKHTIYIKVHWNMTRPDNDTVVAEGFVEPFSRDEGLRAVQLELVGLDDQGKVVNSSEGTPRDANIESPLYPASPFRISMKLNGQEKSFTMTGSYYHYELGEKTRNERIDHIPITSR
jgi:hypothetical protein